ncbi:hypothetical protein ElyMa_002028700 [Elysia marginata]|uniref:Uncharacterized protein n=1 Tax=Elysia marginata TaxID=1093978 RepID=A0AAV4F7H8_9GAST|nr:hypothetical protein ElyMa_002028700 [Elysia marginata]
MTPTYRSRPSNKKTSKPSKVSEAIMPGSYMTELEEDQEMVLGTEWRLVRASLVPDDTVTVGRPWTESFGLSGCVLQLTPYT